MARPRPSSPAQADAFFAGSPLGLDVLHRVQGILDGCGPCDLRAARTQVGWARRRGFASLWMPGRWLRGPVAEVVLSVYLPRRDPSPRWKQVVEVRSGLFAHHLELTRPDDIDDEVGGWLAEAYTAAG